MAHDNGDLDILLDQFDLARQSAQRYVGETKYLKDKIRKLAREVEPAKKAKIKRLLKGEAYNDLFPKEAVAAD